MIWFRSDGIGNGGIVGGMFGGIGLVIVVGMVYAYALWLVVTLSRCGSFLRFANFNGKWRGVCVLKRKVVS